MVAGHTKFCVDRLFSRIATTYNRADVFNADDLQDVIATHASITFDNGEIVKAWREKLEQKYSKVSGVRELRDLLYQGTSCQMRLFLGLVHIALMGLSVIAWSN